MLSEYLVTRNSIRFTRGHLESASQNAWGLCGTHSNQTLGEFNGSRRIVRTKNSADRQTEIPTYVRAVNGLCQDSIISELNAIKGMGERGKEGRKERAS